MGKGLRVPLAGVPVHSVEQHLARLVQAGRRVAICEQLEDAKASKDLVRRGVVRVVSPGTALEPALLEEGRANFCAALAPGRAADGERRLGLAAADLSTGSFLVCELGAADLAAAPTPAEGPALLAAAARSELERLGVSELLLPQGEEHLRAALQGPWQLTSRPQAAFAPQRAAALLLDRYAIAGLEALALADRPAATAAAGALLEYLQGAGPGEEAQAAVDALAHLARPRLYEPSARMRLDPATARALNIVDPGRAAPLAADTPRTVLQLLDRCRSAAGRRLLRESLQRPLLDLERIEQRLDRVAALLARPPLRERLSRELRGLPDLERLLARSAAGLAAPPELAALGAGLAAAGRVAALLPTPSDLSSPPQEEAALARLAARLMPLPACADRLAEELEQSPEAEFGGGVIRAGVDPELDRQRLRLREARERIAALEQEQRQRSGIAALKVGYHRTFGYYLEVPRSRLAQVPQGWERRQSLARSERYVTPELRALESELLAAQEALAEGEHLRFDALRAAVAAEAAELRLQAGALARLDVACGLAQLAAERGWSRPRLDRSAQLQIREGRHPLVEAALPPGRFVPNELQLDGESRQLLLVTGPNMAGKSTYLRQAALIVLLAQSGSFVPAAEVRLGLVDRIFARVGAQDDLAAGQSTFMVEMLETAQLLHNASDRSLLLLDEIGRGTSTYDGLAIAQAVVERLAGRGERGPRTLFATHFYELTALAGTLPRVHNATVAVEEDGAGGARFLHQIVPGAASRSYGIQVARGAGLPPELVQRAAQILAGLEADAAASAPGAAPLAAPPDFLRLEPSALAPPAILEELAAVDIDGRTPLEAISALYALRDHAREELRALQGDSPPPSRREAADLAEQPGGADRPASLDRPGGRDRQSL